ncbi:hypothetical protein V7152_23080, partial [Neobacillus drentensis]|uniref:hypothetical protein n=1 Tax=Neobacillus drentensis TaxID=220684 RepID=UPI002FFDE98D
FSQMFLRKDATKHLVLRVDKLIRKTTIYAKIAFYKLLMIAGEEICLFCQKKERMKFLKN